MEADKGSKGAILGVEWGKEIRFVEEFLELNFGGRATPL